MQVTLHFRGSHVLYIELIPTCTAPKKCAEHTQHSRRGAYAIEGMKYLKRDPRSEQQSSNSGKAQPGGNARVWFQGTNAAASDEKLQQEGELGSRDMSGGAVHPVEMHAQLLKLEAAQLAAESHNVL